MREVRLVGSRFLQDPKSRIDFQKLGREHENPFNAFVNGAIAYLGVPGLFDNKADTQVADAGSPKDDQASALVARADFENRDQANHAADSEWDTNEMFVVATMQ